MPKPHGIFQALGQRIRSYFSTGSINYDSVRVSPARTRVVHTAPNDLKNELTSADQRELLKLMRSLDKNSPFVAAYINAVLTYAVGDGFRYQPLSPNPEWNLQAKDRMELFYSRPEITGRYNWLQLVRMACKAVLVDGEIFFIKTYHRDGMPCLQAIEAHRVLQPPVTVAQGWVQGIKFDRQGRPTTYAVQQDDGSFVYYGASQVIHLYEPDRFTGVRGISKLQVAANGLRDRQEIIAAEKLAVKEFSRRTFVLKTQTGEMDPSDPHFFGGKKKVAENPTSAEDIQNAFGGLSLALGTNESLEAFETTRPNLNVLQMAEALDREVANAVGLSSDFLLNPTKIGGPVVRMELAKAERTFASIARMLIDGLLKPAHIYALGNFIAPKGNTDSPGILPAQQGWEKMAFNLPRRLSIDIGRDTLAMIRELEAGTRNLQDIIEEGGDDAAAQIIARLDFKAWCKTEALRRGLTYEDVSLTTVLSQAAPPDPEPAQPDGEDLEDEQLETEEGDLASEPPTSR